MRTQAAKHLGCTDLAVATMQLDLASAERHALKTARIQAHQISQCSAADKKKVERDSGVEADVEGRERRQEDRAINQGNRERDWNQIPVGLPFTEMVAKSRNFTVRPASDWWAHWLLVSWRLQCFCSGKRLLSSQVQVTVQGSLVYTARPCQPGVQEKKLKTESKSVRETKMEPKQVGIQLTHRIVGLNNMRSGTY